MKEAEDFFKETAKHTRAKLKMLELYVIPWIRKVVLSPWGEHSCCIIDTFAGAGMYEDGTEGSPIILLKEAIDFIEQCKKNKKDINKVILIFIEKEEKNYIQLKENLEKILGEKLIDGKLKQTEKYSQLYVGVEQSTHEGFLKELTEDVSDIIPTIFFMDPFGFSLPFSINKTILTQYTSVELIINVMFEEMNRFISVPSIRERLTNFLGVDDLEEMLSKLSNASKEERREIILGTYIDNLKKAGAKYSLKLGIYGERGQYKMAMVHVTKNVNGFDEMKKVIETVSTNENNEYDPSVDSDDGQMMIEGFNDAKDKSEELAKYIFDNKKGTSISVKDLTYFVKEHPNIPSTYTKKALQKLYKDGKIEKVFRTTGKTVKKNCFPEDAYIKFNK